VLRGLREEVEQGEVNEFRRDRRQRDDFLGLVHLGCGIFASLSLSHVGVSVSKAIVVFIVVRDQRNVVGFVDGRLVVRILQTSHAFSTVTTDFTGLAVVELIQSLSLRCDHCRSHIIIGVV
jgi:hypothetical protein